jgi:hypothetical protein
MRVHLALVAAVAAAAAAPACDVHVAKATSSPFPPDGTLLRPFATITAAQHHVRGLLLAQRQNPLVVCIASGVYREALVFDARDSGPRTESPVIYTPSGPDQNVSVSGSVPLTFSALPQDDPGRAFLTPAAQPSVVVATIPLPLANISAATEWKPRGFLAGGCAAAPMELVVGGVPQTVARWPNAGDRAGGTTPGMTLTQAAPGQAPGQVLTNNSFYAPASAPFLEYKDTADMWAYGFWKWEWADGYARVNGSAAVPGAPGLSAVTFETGGSVWAVTAGARYFVVNSLDALDAPGEYYVNASSGVVYYFPTPPSSASASLSAELTYATDLITGTSASNIWLVGITIENARAHGVALSGGEGFTLVNVTVRNVGTDAVSTYLSNNTAVLGSRISAPGAAGVRYNSGGDRLTLTPSGNIIADTTISGVERVCWTYNPSVSLDTGGVLVHSDISDAPHDAVTVDGNDILVQGNIIHNVSQATFDNGAIYYFNEDWSKYNFTVRFNGFYLNGLGASTCNEQTSCNRDAIYPDNGNAGATIVSNVIYHPSPADRGAYLPSPLTRGVDEMVAYALFDDGGRDKVFSNNLLVLDGSNATFNGAAEITWDSATHSNTSSWYAALEAVGWNQGLYASRYPRLAELINFWPPGGDAECAGMETCGPAPYLNVYAGNVIVNATAVMSYPPESVFPASAFNVTNNWVGVDPVFAAGDAVARATWNFTLADDSPVWTEVVGFQRIPEECFGLDRRCPGEQDWGAWHRGVLEALSVNAPRRW